MAFLNQHQLIEIRTNSDQKAEQHLSHVYGPVLGPALYRACARVWGTGPAVTSARLSNTKELIQDAWLPQGQHSWRAYSQRGPLVSAHLPIKRSVGI